MNSLNGIFPAVTTPFLTDGALDLAGLRANINSWNDAGLAGYLMLGSTGEVVHLTEAEKLAILETSRALIAADKAMIVGTGLSSTQETIAFTRRAAQYGASHALVVTPHYFKSAMTQSVLADYYRAVADSSPIPVLLYSVPQFTGITLAPETIAQLAEHANIVGIKDSAGDVRALTATISFVKEDFIILTGSAPVLASAFMMGAQGAILAVANFIPALCVEIYQLAKNNDWQTARKQQQRMLALSDQIASRYNIGGIKYAMNCLGLAGGTVRSPLVMPDETAQRNIRRTLQECGLLKN
jgi:4-hydroxy-2-oxoglutarate aldolase